MNKRIVFFDLDGTLLNEEKKILESSKMAIKKLQEKGVIAAIATGRPPKSIKWILDELNIHSYITINGQHAVYEGEEVYKKPFEREFLHDIVRFSSTNQHPLVYASLDDMKSSIENHRYIKDVYELGKMSYPPVDKNFFRDNLIYKLILFCEDLEEDFYKERYQIMQFIRWHKYALDVLPNEISKAVGISTFLEMTGIQKENVYAFGDEINDMEMFSAVGTSVAMGNAIPALKEVSDLVTSSNTDDGIFNGLTKLGLI
ncbi:Cof-type HAD-IIB family hydrolase [Neobacillus sp. Marseille-QA0830]